MRKQKPGKSWMESEKTESSEKFESISYRGLVLEIFFFHLDIHYVCIPSTKCLCSTYEETVLIKELNRITIKTRREHELTSEIARRRKPGYLFTTSNTFSLNSIISNVNPR